MYEQIAGIAKAMANAHRLEILDLLANGPKSVEQIAQETALTIANASQHLQVLKREKLVSAERQGNFIYYGLTGTDIYEAWAALRDLALGLSAEMKFVLSDYRNALNSEESLTIRELLEMENVLILDVRDQEEFRSGHLPEAINIPIWELMDRIDELPRRRLIVAYCRGPFCTYADEAVKLLKKSGFEAIRLEENAIDYQLLNN